MIWSGIVLVCLIAFSAFFSASETAFLSTTQVMLRNQQKTGDPQIARAFRLKQNMPKLLTTIIVGNNLANNFASSIAAALAISVAGSNGVGIASIVMTVVIVLFGEILPKTIAAYYPLATVRKIVLPLSVLEAVLTPVVFLFTLWTKVIHRAAGKFNKRKSPFVTEEELKALIDMGNQEGTLEEGEKDMLKRVFEFTDLHAADIMRHRLQVKAIPLDAPYDGVIRSFTASGYSRLPVYEGEPSNYVGLLGYKDVLFYHGRNKADCVHDCMRKLRFIPGTMSAVKVLQVFKTERTNFAAVVDEYGGNLGIVTLTDVLNVVLAFGTN